MIIMSETPTVLSSFLNLSMKQPCQILEENPSYVPPIQHAFHNWFEVIDKDLQGKNNNLRVPKSYSWTGMSCSLERRRLHKYTLDFNPW
jgi:hypothetical protein